MSTDETGVVLCRRDEAGRRDELDFVGPSSIENAFDHGMRAVAEAFGVDEDTKRPFGRVQNAGDEFAGLLVRLQFVARPEGEAQLSRTVKGDKMIRSRAGSSPVFSRMPRV